MPYGEQRKLEIARALASKPRLLLLDEPTRGIDVGAKAEIYRLLRGLAAEGVSILFASSEMEELAALADRVVVMRDGRIQGELAAERAGEEEIMRLATGAVEGMPGL